MTDIEIANGVKLENIESIANKLEIEDIDLYGKYKCKINSYKKQKQGKIILVTATSPTPFGEGKTTISIGLLDALCKKVKAILALREPSLGPVFGVKGGACGGGMSQVVPMEDINLHFTGDFHAITAANNLLCAAIDNEIKQGNKLHIKEVLFHRTIDINDRELKKIKLTNGRNESFNITAASEMMAILCMSENILDLKQRLNNIIIGIDDNYKFIYAKDLDVVGSLCVLLKDAIKPNLVQTLEHNPVIIHGGPFANIAHGCSSVISLNTCKNLCDYVITEAGFGSDCGALKYYDLLCRNNDLVPNVTVLVTSVRALKHSGLDNLKAHISILRKLNLNFLVCLNKFNDDKKEDIEEIKKLCESENILFTTSTSYKDGSIGAQELASKVLEMCNNKPIYKEIYNLEDSIEEKIASIIKNIYGAKEIMYSESSKEMIKIIKDNHLSNLPICIAKTQYSISDDQNKLGFPINFAVTVNKINVSAGAGFIVIYLNNILTMPGLNEFANYKKIDYRDNLIIGLS